MEEIQEKKDQRKYQKMFTTRRLVILGLVAVLFGLFGKVLWLVGLGLALSIIGVVESKRKTTTRVLAVLGIVFTFLGIGGGIASRALMHHGLMPPAVVSFMDKTLGRGRPIFSRMAFREKNRGQHFRGRKDMHRRSFKREHGRQGQRFHARPDRSEGRQEREKVDRSDRNERKQERGKQANPSSEKNKEDFPSQSLSRPSQPLSENPSGN